MRPQRATVPLTRPPRRPLPSSLATWRLFSGCGSGRGVTKQGGGRCSGGGSCGGRAPRRPRASSPAACSSSLARTAKGAPLARPGRAAAALPPGRTRRPGLTVPSRRRRPRSRLPPPEPPARVAANGRPPSCGGSGPDPRQPPAPALPSTRFSFCCSPRGSPEGRPDSAERRPAGGGLREIKLLAQELAGWRPRP